MRHCTGTCFACHRPWTELRVERQPSRTARRHLLRAKFTVSSVEAEAVERLLTVHQWFYLSSLTFSLRATRPG
ncbi:hypothetical protein M3J09_002198 [Ascochyta lentis]